MTALWTWHNKLRGRKRICPPLPFSRHLIQAMDPSPSLPVCMHHGDPI